MGKTADTTRILAALLLPFVACGVQWLFWSTIKPFVWFLFFPTVFFSSRIGGKRIGIISTFTSAILVIYFFLPPQLTFVGKPPGNLLSVLVFIAMGILFSLTHDRLEQIQRREEEALEAARSASEQLQELRIDRLEAEQRQTEDALRKSHARLEKVLEVETVGVMFWDLTSGRLVDANDTFLNIMGYSRSELEAGELTWQRLTPPEYYAVSLAEVEKFLATGRVGPYEKEYLHKDGSRQWFVFAGSSLGDTSCVEFCVDISARKRAESRERGRARTMELMVTGKPLAEILTSIALTVEADEPTALCSILLVDETGQRLVHGAAPRLPDFYNQAINGIAIGAGVGSCGTAAFTRERVIVEDVTVHPYWVDFLELTERAGLRACWSEPILAGDGTVLGTFAIYRREPRAPSPEDLQRIKEAADIASLAIERQRAERALRESEQEFRSLAEAMPQIVWATLPDGGNIYFNRQWVEYTGLTLEESSGPGWIKPFHPEDQPRAWTAWERATKHRDIYSLECRLRRVDGVYRWWLIRGVPFCNDNGEIQKWFGTCTDIEEMKQAEEQIRELNARLEERVRERTTELEAANRELDSFAYAVSHDLRAPLRAMIGFSEALVEDYGELLEGEAREYLQEIVIGSRHMGGLIDGLLTMSRSTRGEVQSTPLDISYLANRIRVELERDAPERRVAWQVEPELSVKGDPMMIEVAMRNLLTNAWKYTATTAEPVIRVYAEENGDGRFICVSDNGAGFDMAHCDRLFKPFQRLHRQDEFPGIGIGLATVQRIVNRHGGSIEATAEPGKGATFKFTLPAP